MNLSNNRSNITIDIGNINDYAKLAVIKKYRNNLSPQARFYFGVMYYGIHSGGMNYENKCKNQPGFKKYLKFLNEAREMIINDDTTKISPNNKLYQLRKTN